MRQRRQLAIGGGQQFGPVGHLREIPLCFQCVPQPAHRRGRAAFEAGDRLGREFEGFLVLAAASQRDPDQAAMRPGQPMVVAEVPTADRQQFAADGFTLGSALGV